MSPTALNILLICLLAGASLFFTLTVTALRMFSRAKLQELFKNSQKQNHTDEIARNTEKLISACSLYRIISNICLLLVIIGTFAGLRQGNLQVSDYLLVFVIGAVILLLFSFIIPHAGAKYAAEKIVRRTYKLLMFFAITAWPILCFIQLFDRLARRLAGVVETTPEEKQEEKQEEFLTNLEQHRMEGTVDEEEQEMIENVLELSDSTADEIMTPRTDIVAVDIKSDLETIVETIPSAGHSRFPVYEDNIDNILGLLYAKDLLTEIGKNPKNFKLRDKIRDAYFIPETKLLRTLLHEFQNRKLHIAVVLDEYGGTAGIVTIEDVLEELVGEITDEYEKTPPQQINKIDRNTIELDARTYIDDVNDEFNLNLPEDEDYDTVGGFVFSHLGYIPKVGVTFDYEKLRFTVRSANARKIERLRIEKFTEQ